MPVATLSLLEFGVILNILGVLVATAFTAVVAFMHRAPYFRWWTWSHIWMVGSLPVAYVAGEHPGHMLASFAAMAVYQYHVLLMVQTGYALDDRQMPGGALGLNLAFLAVGFAGMAMGGGFLWMAVVGSVYMLGGHFFLAWMLVRRGQALRTTRYLAAMVAASGLWFATFPLWFASPWLWLGYAVCGLWHLLVGVGMVVYLLEDLAHELHRRNAALETLDCLKRDFIANMSHELRTPLTVIGGGAQLLEDGQIGPLNPTQSKLVASIVAHSNRLGAMVESLLDFTRLEAGEMVFQLEDGDLAGLVAEALDNMHPEFEAKGLHLVTALPATPQLACYDAQKIYQVVLNLLSNACKFTPKGGRIDVAVMSRDGKVRVTVGDTGIGIAPSEWERIFTKFYQIDSTSTRTAEGAGLGLALSKAIVEAHQGTIAVVRSSSAGTLFELILPASASAGQGEGGLEGQQAS